jgi:histidine triad (HIT) family protein
LSCVFCEIAAGRIPAQKVRETPDYLAFRDIHPAAPTHILFIPKKHLGGIRDAAASDASLIGGLCLAAAEVARSEKLDGGYRLVVNSGSEGGQTVDHLHVHLLGGRRMTWPPG